MTKARELIEAVAAGKSARRLLTEAEAPSWKPGQPVPEGYMVVFGKLVKAKGAATVGGSPHYVSTMAYQASAAASEPDLASQEHIKRQQDAMHGHALAYHAHQKASLLGSVQKKDEHNESAHAHKRAFNQHRAQLKSLGVT